MQDVLCERLDCDFSLARTRRSGPPYALLLTHLEGNASVSTVYTELRSPLRNCRRELLQNALGILPAYASIRNAHTVLQTLPALLGHALVAWSERQRAAKAR
jgi:hypothetical protein